MMKIGFDLLRQKAGSRASRKEFRQMIREIMAADNLPEYHVLLDHEDNVTLYLKDSTRLVRSLSEQASLCVDTSWWYRVFTDQVDSARVQARVITHR